jgi:hypothetical protein
MLDLFFAGGAGLFTVLAVIGTSVFLLRLVMLFVGHHMGDMHVDSGDMGDAHHGDSSDAFKALSLQSLAAFSMGFGWGGLGALKGSKMAMAPSLLVAIVAGVGMVWLLALLLKGIADLHASGTIPITKTIGTEGDVYANIPPSKSGQGQVRITVDSRQRIYNADTKGEALPTNTRIRVVAVNDDNSLTVIPVA